MSTEAPRLEWTGERYLPGSGGVQIALEHLHRYRFAARLLGGRTVLDAASGEGYGASMLAASGARVTGVEIDPETVDYATNRYPDVEVRLGDVTALPFPDASFEAVVSFETIEHVAEPERAIAEFRRVLVAGGVLLLSTPNTPGAPDATIAANSFHRSELDEGALRRLLETFDVESILPQRILGLSVLGEPDPGLDLSRLPGDAGEPRFLIAVARKPGPRSEVPLEGFPVPSGLLEPQGDLIAEYGRWLRRGQSEARAVADAKDELNALHDDLGRRYLALEATTRATHAEGQAHRTRAEALSAENQVLREANARLTHDYDELAAAQSRTLEALAAAASALRGTEEPR